VINHHSNKRQTQDEINKKADMWSRLISESSDTFILPEDPLYKYHPVFLPYRKCQCCGHDKFFLVYHYKCWEIGPKRMSHFGILRCDKCGESITWVNKYLRDAVIKRNNINIAEID